MEKDQLEPGLLQIFRLYTWLQCISILVFPLPHMLLGAVRPEIRAGYWPPLAFLGIHTLGLLILTYWDRLRRRLGKTWFPLAVCFAAAGLLFEERFFFGRGIYWQGYPFLTILLILVAWQYRYRTVLAFTFIFALLGSLLVVAVPLSAPFIIRIPPQISETTLSFLFMGTVLTTYLIVGYVVNRLVESQRQQRKQLAEINLRLLTHSATVEQLAVSRERLRLSRELHDTLAHTLSAQAVQFEALLTFGESLPPKARRMLNQMYAATVQGLDETRRALTALRASPLEELGLVGALQQYAADFSGRYPLEIESHLPKETLDIPLDVEQCFYRIAQEAFENAARHAEASRLNLTLEIGPAGALHMMIADNGIGFQPDQDMRNRLGVRGMFERAEMIGADLKVVSQPGQGVKLHLFWEPKT